jgi:hypothetical protein
MSLKKHALLTAAYGTLLFAIFLSGGGYHLFNY